MMTMTLALYLHLLSLTVLAAGNVGGLVVHRMLVSAHATAPALLPGVAGLNKRFGITATIGGFLMLLSGLFFAYTRGWVDMTQPWLHGKLALWLIMALNGALVARPLGAKLIAALDASAKGEDTTAAIAYNIRCLGLVHLVHTLGLIALITLGVFGPR